MFGPIWTRSDRETQRLELYTASLQATSPHRRVYSSQPSGGLACEWMSALSTRRAVSPPEIRRARTAAKLVLRKGMAMESDKLRDLPLGTTVMVLEETDLGGGVVRAKVGIDSSPRGVAVHALGWVTVIKDGESKLFGDGGEYTWRPADGTTMRSSDSMAARIAARRRKSAEIRAKARAEPAPAPEQTGGADSETKVAKKKEKVIPFMTENELRKLATEYRQRAETGGGAASSNSLASKLGDMMVKKNVKVDQVVREWDANGDVRTQHSNFVPVSGR